jgi:hypothetical protein
MPKELVMTTYSGVLCPELVQQFWNLTATSPAAPVGSVSFVVYTYLAGTTTPTPTYTDASLGVIGGANDNPVVLNSAGQANIFLIPTIAYKFVFTTSNDTNPPTSPIYTVDNVYPSVTATSISSVLTQQVLGQIEFPQTTAEKNASVTPTYYIYPPGDLRRYGADTTGVNDSTTAINSAIAVAQNGLGFVYHPGGNIQNASQIVATGGWSLFGFDRTACVFTYTGTASLSAWKIQNQAIVAPNSSGFGLWNMDGVSITTAVTGSTGAGLEINACGYAYYQVRRSRVTGTFKYGIILDGTEVTNIIDNIVDNGSGVTGAVNIWLTDGPDRTPTQAVGYTNSINITNNQLNNGLYNIADDGGSDHNISFNNFNGASVGAYLCAIEGLTFRGNELENVTVSPSTSAVANVLFSDQTSAVGSISTATITPCQGGEICNNFFGMNMTSSSRALKFTAPGSSGYHTGITVSGNYFRNNTGNSASIDVTFLATSQCWRNYDASVGSHYTGVHNDQYGNTLFPPVTGSAATGATLYVWGDNSKAHQFDGGMIVGSLGTTLAAKLKGTQAMAGTTVAVAFGVTLAAATYQVSLCANLTGGPFWVTSKATTGFTINAGSSFTGNVDWIVEL